MSDQRLDEYRAYYDARTERYANNPNRRHSYEAEGRLRDLFYKYDTLEEIRDHFGTLNIDCAFAAWRDQYEMESQYYESVEQPVRKKGADDILAQLPNHTDVTDMGAVITDISNRNNVEIYSDCYSGEALINAWGQLDAITAFTNAEVPDEYKSYMLEQAEEIRQHIRENVQDTEKTMGEWIAGWRMKPETVLQNRHRRQLPYSDADVEQHLEQFKTITNR